jgi:hypothetical protein
MQDLDVELQNLLKATVPITSGEDIVRSYQRTSAAIDKITHRTIKLLSLPAFYEVLVYLMDLPDTLVSLSRTPLILRRLTE